MRQLKPVRLLAVMPSIPLGGMERAALRVMQELQAREVDVHVLTNWRWGDKVRREVEAAGLAQSGISHVHSLKKPRSPIEWAAAAKSMMVSEREIGAAHRRHSATALLATSVSTAWFARKLARRTDTVSVFRIPNPPVFGSQRMGTQIDRAIWKTIGESFDHLVCNSRYAAELVSMATGERGNVRVVRNYAPSLDRRIETPAPSLSGRRRVLFLGQIAPQKGVDILFAAAQSLFRNRNDVEVVLAGPGMYLDDYRDKLIAEIDAAALSDRFYVLPHIDDVQELLHHADVHVCPSVSAGDSFPNVILDAKLAGVPSVVFPTAGLPEAIENGVDGLITPDRSPEQLAAAIAALIDDEPRRRAMGEAARASLMRHDPVALSSRWLDLISSKTAQ